MAQKTWQGGDSTTAQVDTFTLALTWAAADTLTTTLTAEDASTQTVVTTSSSTVIETIRDAHVSDLQASTNSLFTAITWAKSGTDAITGTAKTAGVPFTATASEATAGNGTYTRAATTANSGPHDWNDTGNWVEGSIPVDTDTVDILPHPTNENPDGSPKSYDILYGLNQSSIDLTELRVGKSFRAAIGDAANQYYLRIDCASGSANTVLHSSGHTIWIDGAHDQINVVAATGGPDAVRINGTTTNLRVLGASVNGRIRVADGSTVTNAYIIDCPGADVFIGTGGTITLLEANAGAIEIGKAITTANTYGTANVTHTDGAVATWNQRGGTVHYNGSGILTTLTIFSGLFDLTLNETSGVTITDAIIYGGVLDDRSGLNNVTYTNNIIQYGGDISTDSGVTVQYA